MWDIHTWGPWLGGNADLERGEGPALESGGGSWPGSEVMLAWRGGRVLAWLRSDAGLERGVLPWRGGRVLAWRGGRVLPWRGGRVLAWLGSDAGLERGGPALES